jgi:NAD-dependent SIR2 family protein deacetylase
MTKRSARVKENTPSFALFRSLKSPSFDEGVTSVVELLRGKKNIVVLTGAGISVSCGIPDFRSKGTGLYSTLDAQVRTTGREEMSQSLVLRVTNTRMT